MTSGTRVKGNKGMINLGPAGKVHYIRCYPVFGWSLNPTALRMVKSSLSLGYSECKKVKQT